MSRDVERVLQGFYDKHPEVEKGYLSIHETEDSLTSIFVNISDILKEILGDIVVEAWYEVSSGYSVKELENDLHWFEKDTKEEWIMMRQLEFECFIIINFTNGRSLKISSAEWGFIYP